MCDYDFCAIDFYIYVWAVGLIAINDILRFKKIHAMLSKFVRTNYAWRRPLILTPISEQIVTHPLM